MQRIYPKYDTFAGLNYLQRTRATERLGRRVPLVYGTDLFVTDPQLLSHRITVANGAIVHDSVALISYGSGAGNTVGEIGKVDPNLYADGVKLSGGSVVATRPGTAIDIAYPTHPVVYKSIRVSGKSVTIPTKLPDGSTVTAADVVYLNGTVWTSLPGTPGQTITLPAPSAWVSLKTTTPAVYPSLATALTKIETTETDFTHPDIYVREGKLINRLIGAGKGAYAPDASHTITGTQSYLYDVQDNKTYPLPLTGSPLPTFDYDGDWLVYRKGISDRFPDVVNNLITTSSGGNTTTANPESLIDYQSFVTANAHAEALGLKFAGSIDEPISILDFVTDYACFFDLIPMRDRNRLALIPHITEETYLLGLFTFFNCSDLAWHFDPIEQHDYSQISAATHSGDSLVTQVGTSRYSEYSSLLLDASMVMQNTDSLKLQLTRIYESANKQGQSVEVFAPLEYQGLKAGDFIAVESDYFTDDRTHLGGVMETTTPGIYDCILEDVYTTFVIKSETTKNTITFDADNRGDSKGRVPFRVDDILAMAISSDTQIYGIVTSAAVSAADIEVKFDTVTWVDNKGTWVKDGKTVALPKDTIVTCYKVGGMNGRAFVYNTSGIPQTVSCTLITAPGSNRYGKLTVLAKIADYSDVLASSPIIFVGDEKLWRVSSIEPLTLGMTKSVEAKDEPAAGTRQNEGYRVRATLYPFASPKTYPQTAKPPTSSTDTDPVAISQTKSSAETLDYLAEIATGNEFSNVDDVTHVWRSGPITIAVDGNASPADLKALDTVLAELQTLTGKTITIVPGPTADVKFHVGPESGFSTVNPNYVAENLGFFWRNFNAGGDIVSGDVLIDNAKTDQDERNHLIREELTQLIVGLPDDSYRYADSIFYQPWTKTQTYSELDREIIKLMSKPTVTSGMNSTQLRAAAIT